MIEESSSKSGPRIRLRSLDDIFPGVEGRMEMIRVMIHLRKPELRYADRSAPLEPAMIREILRALEAIRHG